MFNQPNKILASEVTGGEEQKTSGKVNSFKNIRKARRKIRVSRGLEKSDTAGNKKLARPRLKDLSPGPTAQTLAKLTPDPLICFRNKNILNDQQIWAFQRIRRAVHIITRGTHLRVSCLNDVAVQTSRFSGQEPNESDFEIALKTHYSHWIDRMTQTRQRAGPVLDIIIDEMSLNAVDRKWGKRKGWAKDRIQQALDLYGAFLPSIDRDG